MKTKRMAFVLGFCSFFIFTASGQANPGSNKQIQDTRPLILEHVNVINPAEDTPRLDQTIVVLDGKIQSISPAAVTVPGERIDLGGAWVLPGLIYAHAHPMNIAAARCMLSCGITTGRSLLAWNYADIGLRSLHQHGDVDIPTILAAGYPVLANYVRFKPDITAIFLDLPALGDLRSLDRIGPDGARRIVRANVVHQADWIKVFANERGGILETEPSARNLNDEELQAAVEEATRLGFPVAAHAYSDEGVAAAVNAGVRTIEHGSLITEPTLRLMRDHGTYLVPTLFGFSVMPASDSTPEEWALQPRLEMLLKSGHQAVATARRLGVPVIAGADSEYGEKDPTLIDEIMQLAAAGFSNLEAIRAATSWSAECLRISSSKGALRVGLDADMVIYKTNPVRDLAVLRQPMMIINGGRIFRRQAPPQ